MRGSWDTMARRSETIASTETALPPVPTRCASPVPAPASHPELAATSTVVPPTATASRRVAARAPGLHRAVRSRWSVASTASQASATTTNQATPTSPSRMTQGTP